MILVDLLVAYQPRDEREQQRDPRDDDQGDQAEERAVGAEEDRDGHDGQELPDRSGGHDERAEPALEHLVVPQDRQQGAQRGRGQADRDRHERTGRSPPPPTRR